MVDYADTGKPLCNLADLPFTPEFFELWSSDLATLQKAFH